MEAMETHHTHFATVILLACLVQLTRTVAISIVAMANAQLPLLKVVFVQAVHVLLDTIVKLGVHLMDIATTIALVTSYFLPMVEACLAFEK